MGSRLLIIRGNSGSGKTTIAKRLQRELGSRTMLVSHDVLRREILRVKDEAGNPSIQLVYDTVMYGSAICYDVILEGILPTKKYGEMLHQLVQDFNGRVFAYYFDIPFEETLKRHMSTPTSNEYNEKEMRQWWNDKDYLTAQQEKILTSNMSEAQIIQMILNDLGA